MPGTPMPAKSAVTKTATPEHEHSEAAGSVKDLVCGMDVDPKEASASGLKVEHDGKTYYFCSEDCKTKFAASPGQYLKAEGGGR